jgi:hypothetical protein
VESRATHYLAIFALPFLSAFQHLLFEEVIFQYMYRNLTEMGIIEWIVGGLEIEHPEELLGVLATHFFDPPVVVKAVRTSEERAAIAPTF